MPDAAQLGVEVVEHAGQHGAGELIEVVRDRPGLVDRRRLAGAQLVGQPEQVDELGEPAAGRPRDRCSRSAIRRRVASTDCREASVGCAVNTGRSSVRGRMPSRRSRSSSECEPLDEAVQRTPVAQAAGGQLPRAVQLLGDVRQLEERRERARQHHGRRHVEPGQQLGQLVGGWAGDPPASSALRRASRRTCSTRSSTSAPAWRTRVSPSIPPRRRMSARIALWPASETTPACVSTRIACGHGRHSARIRLRRCHLAGGTRAAS